MGEEQELRGVSGGGETGVAGVRGRGEGEEVEWPGARIAGGEAAVRECHSSHTGGFPGFLVESVPATGIREGRGYDSRVSRRSALFGEEQPCPGRSDQC